MSNKNSLSIIIPAYNEARRLPGTLHRVSQYMRKSHFGAHEIIIVDDGSSDATAEVAQGAARKEHLGNVRVLRAGRNRGKGAALRSGVLASEGEFVLCTDADLSTPIQEVDKLLRPIHAGADVAIGSRSVAQSEVEGKPLYRRALSGVSNFVIRAVLGLPFRDTQCGFKLYRRDAAVRLFAPLSLPRFSYDFEVLSRAQSSGMRIAEVGVRWQQSDSTTVRTRDVLQCLVDVFRVRFGIMHTGTAHLWRFMTVGVVNTAVDAAVYVALTRLPLFDQPPVAAKLFSFLAATISSFYLNRRWTFGIRTPLTLVEIARFYLTVSASMVLNVSMMYALVHILGMYDLVALVFTTLCTFGLNYTLSRLWVWSPKSAPQGA